MRVYCDVADATRRKSPCTRCLPARKFKGLSSHLTHSLPSLLLSTNLCPARHFLKEYTLKRSTTQFSSDVMNAQKPITFINDAVCSRWVGLVIQKRQQLLEWVSTIHPQKLACQIEGNFFHGSYNLGQKVTFSDGTKWLIRFPLFGHVSPRYMDEKVAMEVEAMKFISEKTAIPIPEIKHWGPAAENPLGLGPFIIMDFIEGISLDGLLSNPDAKQHFRLIREDVSDDTIEVLYRQFANILLQLFQLDFNRIGSLPMLKTGFHVPIRPLTFKVHDIQQTGGANTFGKA